MGKILKISDRLAERTGGRFCGDIVTPVCVSERGSLIQLMLKRLETLKTSDNNGNHNYARLSAEQEMLFLEKITKRLELE